MATKSTDKLKHVKVQQLIDTLPVSPLATATVQEMLFIWGKWSLGPGARVALEIPCAADAAAQEIRVLQHNRRRLSLGLRCGFCKTGYPVL